MADGLEDSMIERPRLALRRIRQLRARRRLMRVVTGLLRWLAIASAAVWLSFLLDWIAVLPTPLRVAQGLFWTVFLLTTSLLGTLVTASKWTLICQH